MIGNDVSCSDSARHPFRSSMALSAIVQEKVQRLKIHRLTIMFPPFEMLSWVSVIWLNMWEKGANVHGKRGLTTLLWTSWCWTHQMTHLRSWPMQGCMTLVRPFNTGSKDHTHWIHWLLGAWNQSQTHNIRWHYCSLIASNFLAPCNSQTPFIWTLTRTAWPFATLCRTVVWSCVPNAWLYWSYIVH